LTASSSTRSVLRARFAGDPSSSKWSPRCGRPPWRPTSNRTAVRGLVVRGESSPADLSRGPLVQVPVPVAEPPSEPVRARRLGSRSDDFDARPFPDRPEAGSEEEDAAGGSTALLIFQRRPFDRRHRRPSGRLAATGRLAQGVVAVPLGPSRLCRSCSETERRRCWCRWNDYGEDYPQDRCIHHLFEAASPPGSPRPSRRVRRPEADLRRDRTRGPTGWRGHRSGSGSAQALPRGEGSASSGRSSGRSDGLPGSLKAEGIRPPRHGLSYRESGTIMTTKRAPPWLTTAGDVAQGSPKGPPQRIRFLTDGMGHKHW